LEAELVKQPKLNTIGFPLFWFFFVLYSHGLG
jgi:hypothetical protein